jgi:iron complex outermembrane receptor protein
MKLRACLASAIAIAVVCDAAFAMEQPSEQMADMSLEQLSNIVVTSVSRQETRLGTAPASLYIISGSDIRRSGARSLPEALRLAPNLQVARVDARNYAVTARGFNSPFENKLLMLIDGRSVYTPLFSGVFWDAQDVVMADIARIEVISGPGATIWGANAVNGVINVITKPASDTQGGQARLRKSAEEHGGSLRYGGALGNGGHYRLYAKTVREDDRNNIKGLPVPFGYHRSQMGFRADWLREGGGMTLSGDAYRGRLHQSGTRDIAIGGANVLARYTTRLGDGSDLRLQAIFDHTNRDQPGSFVDHLNTVDLEAQHGVALGEHHKLAWGGGLRQAADRLSNSPGLGFLPAQLNMRWANIFAQDEWRLAPAWLVTAGIKFEHNLYTGMETLPNLRLSYTPDASQLLWTSLARTIRAPSRFDRDLHSPSTPLNVPGLPRFFIAGGPNFMAETADVFELGYRAQPLPVLSYSITAYVNDFDKLRTLERQGDGSQQFMNMGMARSRGLEMWTRWQVLPSWRLEGGLLAQHVRSSVRPGSTDATAARGLATNDPKRQWNLRSSHDIGEHLQLDLMFRHVGQLPSPVVKAYKELDMQLNWNLTRDIDVALTGQNLLHRRHVEWGAATATSQYERSVLLSATLRF